MENMWERIVENMWERIVASVKDKDQHETAFALPCWRV